MNTHPIIPRRSFRRTLPSWFGSVGSELNFAPFDRLFSDLTAPVNAFEASADFAPVIDVENSDDEVRVTAELPGLEEADFEVIVEENVLTLKGEKRSEQTSDDAGYQRIERSSGSFERRFRFAWEVDPESVSASYKHGVLQVVIPKPAEERSEARTIPVTSD